jgi:hypothetical protein
VRWNRPKVERPEYPKLVAIAATSEEVRDLLPALLQSDPDAEIVDGGGRGIFARVNNEAAEMIAKQYGENRSFPLR